MTKEEFEKMIDDPRARLSKQQNPKIRIIRCKACGSMLEMPNMLSEKVRKDVLHPYCYSGTVFTISWIISRGWHCTRHEAEPSGAFLCPNCYEEGTPEYTMPRYGDDWCDQAKKWMEEQ